MQRRLAKRHMLRLLGSTNFRMMLKVSFAEGAPWPVQQPAMICVFERISP